MSVVCVENEDIQDAGWLAGWLAAEQVVLFVE